MNFFGLYRYLRHLIKANTLHGTHSPFVYKLLEDVFYKSEPKSPEIIDKIRSGAKSDHHPLTQFSPGAGSKSSKKSTISTLEKISSISKKNGELLFRFTHFMKPGHILELGTCIGISTLYLASATDNPVHTIEGNSERYETAKKHFKESGLTNILSQNGSFEAVLPGILNEIPHIDLIFFDGNHKYQPTLDYFNMCLEKTTENSVFIFDDINWSPEMHQAWEAIKLNERVTITIDIFYMGFVFFRKTRAKEHFTIRY